MKTMKITIVPQKGYRLHPSFSDTPSTTIQKRPKKRSHQDIEAIEFLRDLAAEKNEPFGNSLVILHFA